LGGDIKQSGLPQDPTGQKEVIQPISYPADRTVGGVCIIYKYVLW